MQSKKSNNNFVEMLVIEFHQSYSTTEEDRIKKNNNLLQKAVRVQAKLKLWSNRNSCSYMIDHPLFCCFLHNHFGI